MRKRRAGRPFVFISYSHHDESTAIAIVELLRKATVGAVDFFVAGDARSMESPEAWVVQIEAAIRKAWCVIAILSHAGASSEWVLFETGYAHALKIPIIPMGINGFAVARHHPPLSLLPAVDVEDAKAFSKLLRRLADLVYVTVTEPIASSDFDAVFGKGPHLPIPHINTFPLVNKREIYRELVTLVKECNLNDEIRATSMIFDPGDLEDSHFLQYLEILATRCADADRETSNMLYHVIVSVSRLPLSRRVCRALRSRVAIFHAVESAHRMRIFAIREHWSMNLLLVGRSHAIIAFPADPKDGNVRFGIRVSGSEFVAPLVDWYDRCVEQRAQNLPVSEFLPRRARVATSRRLQHTGRPNTR